MDSQEEQSPETIATVEPVVPLTTQDQENEGEQVEDEEELEEHPRTLLSASPRPPSATPELAQEALVTEDEPDTTSNSSSSHHHGNNLLLQLPVPTSSCSTNTQQQQQQLQAPSQPVPQQQKIFSISPATTPEPSSISSSSLFTSWYSVASSSSSLLEQESKTYRNYVQNIDKCLKQFEYSTEWPDLIAALTKLNKVISTYNSTLQLAQQQQQQQAATTTATSSSSSSQPPTNVQQQQLQPPPLPLPRTHLITKRLSQCLHPNLPSGVHLKTLETFELIFQGFKYHDYVNLESELFSFVSGLLPLWSYAAISVKPKLLSLYENHLVALGERLGPALDGVMLSLFTGLVDDGVEQDIKIRTTNLLQTLSCSHPATYYKTLNNLITNHPSIHLPLITHITTTSYLPPPTVLLHLVTSPNTLVQRNALELLNKSYDINELPRPTQIQITRSVCQTLLKRDPSITRRVFSYLEQHQHLLVAALESLIQDCEDGQAFTRILSTVLDNNKIDILERILAPVVKYLMKCEYNTSLSFLSTLNSSLLCKFFLTYLFEHESLEDLESRVIVFNYVVKMRLFDIDYDRMFQLLIGLEDTHIRVILQMVRLHYTEHVDSFVKFCNEYMSKYFDLEMFNQLLLLGNDGGGGTTSIDAAAAPPPPSVCSSSSNSNSNVPFNSDFESLSLEFILELLQKSNPDETAFKYVLLGACTNSRYTKQYILTYMKFQDQLQRLVSNTQALYLIFQATYALDRNLLNSLKYPEKYLLSEMRTDEQIRNVIELDLSYSPLVVLKLVDPVTMGSPYRRFICEKFISCNSSLIMGSVLKYLEFSVVSKDDDEEDDDEEEQQLINNGFDVCSKLVTRAKSEGDITMETNNEDDCIIIGNDNKFKHAQSVVGMKEEPSSYYGSTTVSETDNYYSNNKSSRKKSLPFQDECCAYDSARVNTLVEKLEFVIEVNREFLQNVDLVVLLSKLVLLATISNSQERDPTVTLQIQTRALRLIRKIIQLHGETTHSFVYDSILNHLSNAPVTEYALLWELDAVQVLKEFFALDIENYTLALVVQKRLGARSNNNYGVLATKKTQMLNELCERVHLRWLGAIESNLKNLRKHFNALVLITYTSVCKNLLDHHKSSSESYTRECIKYINSLLRHVLVTNHSSNTLSTSNSIIQAAPSTPSSFLSSLFGGATTKEQTVDEHEALRIAILGKLDLLLKIACALRVTSTGPRHSCFLHHPSNAGLLELLHYLYDNHEQQLLQATNKCIDCPNLELVLKDLKIPSSKLLLLDKIHENVPVLCKYMRHDRNIDVHGIVQLCKQQLSSSPSNILVLVTEYLRSCSNTNSSANTKASSKELQDLVVKAIEMGVEKREFSVLELYVPSIFDLVWGECEDSSGSGAGGGGGGASNANARDQKIIVNVVHGVVVAVLVAVKAGSTSTSLAALATTTTTATSVLDHPANNNSSSSSSSSSLQSSSLLSALRVLEQISHHTYLRKSWKKEVFDLITNEPTFFYFTPECLGSWKVIVDNLFTQDRSTFSELITRLTQTTQMSTSALNIFSSRESEVYETRASLLKRLAFVLHSSERDQYAKYITNIQEKIAEALKLTATSGSSSSSNVLVPAVNKSVFLCFRIMVNKFNCNVLVSLWPIIVHEVVMVLTSLQQLLDDQVAVVASSEQSSQQPPPSIPSHAHLQMYLQTLKLLNFLFTLPSSDSQIPHFQLYKWAFCTESTSSSSSSTTTPTTPSSSNNQDALLNNNNNNNNYSNATVSFTPYLQRLRTKALVLYPSLRFNTPPLRVKTVCNLEELCGAFGCLDYRVSENEWEVVDFCDGYGSSSSSSPSNNNSNDNNSNNSNESGLIENTDL